MYMQAVRATFLVRFRLCLLNSLCRVQLLNILNRFYSQEGYFLLTFYLCWNIKAIYQYSFHANSHVKPKTKSHLSLLCYSFCTCLFCLLTLYKATPFFQSNVLSTSIISLIRQVARLYLQSVL